MVEEGRGWLLRLEQGDTDVEGCVALLEQACESLPFVFQGVSSADDVADGDLATLLAPYYLGRAVARLQASGPRARLKVVERSVAATKQFLSLVARLDLIEGDRDDEPPESAAAARDAAIERHERRRRTRDKINELQEQLDDGEDVRREKLLLEVLDAAQAALDDLRMSDRELAMLRHVVDNDIVLEQEEPPHEAEGIDVLRVDRQGDGRLQVERDRVRAAVFTPDPRRLPTVSLEEAADRELADALRRHHAPKTPTVETRRTAQLEADGDEEDEARYDEATRRDEAWDTWREHHPRGSGNTMGRN